MGLSITEENYIKAIFKLSENSLENISTNAIASEIKTKAASVTDMLQRLADKDLLRYKKYKGVKLTSKGNDVAIDLVRRHRLWEVFLVEKLNFNWDQVHEVAEELEHVSSPLLTSRLDQFLNFPRYDPHGDPIPDKDGNIPYFEEKKLSELENGDKGIIVNVNEQSPEFLQYLDKLNIAIQSKVEVLESNDYDGSRQIKINNDTSVFTSHKVCKNLIVKKIK
ncbi:MAG: metal-dependent transcriptional regulator [Chitinophagales bacterium]